MIHVQQHPLTDPEAKEIHDWLNLPGRRKFQAYLHNCAAALAADAANIMAREMPTMPSENMPAPALDSYIQEARDTLADAHRFRAAADLLVKYSDPESKFIMSDLLPEPITPTQEIA